MCINTMRINTATDLPLRGDVGQTYGVVGLNEHDPGGQRLLEGTLRAREAERTGGGDWTSQRGEGSER